MPKKRLVLPVPVVAAALLIVTAFSASCGDPTGPDPDPELLEAGLAFMEGAPATDTIGAWLPDTVVVTVADSLGRPLPGVEVRLGPVADAGAEPLVVVYRSRPPHPLPPDGLTRDTTDDAGRVRVRVRLLNRPGTALVVASAPSLGLADTTTVTVRPGAPAVARLEPADSALFVGRGYRLRPSIEDRTGNVLDEAFTLELLEGPLSLDGDSITASAFGRGRVVLTSGTLEDTAAVSVVPEATLALYRAPTQPGGVGAIVTVLTDGSELTTLLARTVPYIGPSSWGYWPAWSPDASEIAFIDAGRLEVLTVATGATRLLVDDGALPVDEDFPPEYDAAGRWIYFTRGHDGSQHTVWRVRPDGAGLEQVSSEEDWGLEQRGSPSPDGSRIAYHSNRTSNSTTEFELHVRTLGGGVDSLGIAARFPRWSPTGDWIAYDGVEGLRRVRPDGTDDGSLGVGGFEPGFDWSPDGEWLVVDRWTHLELVRISDGLRLPLRLGSDLHMPDWRP